MSRAFTPEIELDRRSPTPLHAQISGPLEKLITSGTLHPGTLIENEVSMAARLNVSRPTARRALQTLVDHGLLLRRRGAGTIVAPKPTHRLFSLSSLKEDLTSAGHTPTTEILSYECKLASQSVADRLGVDVGTDVVELERLRYMDGIPLAILYNWLPLANVPPRSELEEGGLYEFMRGRGIMIASTHQMVGAQRAQRREARLLDIAVRQPTLTIERTAFDQHGQIVEWGFHTYRADRYRYESTVFAEGHA